MEELGIFVLDKGVTAAEVAAAAACCKSGPQVNRTEPEE